METEVTRVSKTSVLDLYSLRNTPSNFFAGKSGLCLDKWNCLTSDRRILNAISGCRIEFHEFPMQFQKPSQIQLNDNERISMDDEIHSLSKHKVIEKVSHCKGEYISNIFPRAKKDGSSRVILNLRALNKFVEYHHFKMDTLKSAIQLMRPNCFFASVDLKDAYYSIPVCSSDRKFLRFFWNGELYQFTCLAMGLTSAPRIFTKIMKCVFSSLRKLGFLNTGYIDDSLLQGDTFQECTENVKATVELMDDLGLTIHPEKSVVVPVQIIEYLGFVLNSITMTVSLTREKSEKIKSMCSEILTKLYVSLRELSELIGKLVASEPGVMYAPLFYKRLEIAKNKALKHSKGDYDHVIQLDQDSLEDISWWQYNIVGSFKPVSFGKPTIVLHSDASKTGWGGVFENVSTGGHWSEEEADWHINCLELYAAFLTLKSFCSEKRDEHIRMVLDNTTSVIYINKQGGTKTQCNSITREILLWCRERSLWLSAAFLPGSDNITADKESRKTNVDTEWMLNGSLFIDICSVFDKPDIDLFASRLNYRMKPYVAWQPDPEATFIDAFSVSWHDTLNYIFPPFSLLGAVLQKVEEDQAEAILIAPIWTTQFWFPRLLKLLVDCPRMLPVTDTVLQLPQDPTACHKLIKQLNLTVFRLSGKLWKRKEFRRQLSTSFCPHGEILHTNNIGVITKSGCCFVSGGISIPFHRM